MTLQASWLETTELPVGVVRWELGPDWVVEQTVAGGAGPRSVRIRRPIPPMLPPGPVSVTATWLPLGAGESTLPVQIGEIGCTVGRRLRRIQ